MDILLHICCGPCLIYPFSRLKERGFGIRGFYYNPNLYPAAEYLRRVEGLKILAKEFALEVEYPEFRDADFFQAVSAQKDYPERCCLCWSLRLRKTAQQAKAGGFAAFSTTLLVSPYQNHELLKQLGQAIGQEAGIDFYYEDFRPGFRRAQLEAKQKGIYRQKYCGCKYSLDSRRELKGEVKV
ncbi:MAG TPA: epoxyqueuosine reductase QueH [Candidatus Omnitrophota bacterium]|nr:epoxyqueuosine reductase QueH [Candidatus Omnitrophota bacterium]HPT38644.1 epoxyqueuosine reductase QueH [Candidatus Omnitrophota bacterium]